MTMLSNVQNYESAIFTVWNNVRLPRDESKHQENWILVREIYEFSTTSLQSERNFIENIAEFRNKQNPRSSGKTWKKFSRPKAYEETIDRNIRVQTSGSKTSIVYGIVFLTFVFRGR